MSFEQKRGKQFQYYLMKTYLNPADIHFDQQYRKRLRSYYSEVGKSSILCVPTPYFYPLATSRRVHNELHRYSADICLRNHI